MARKSLLARLRPAPPSPDPARWSFQDYRRGVAMLDQVKHDIRTNAFEAAESHLDSARAELGCDQFVLIASAEIAQSRGDWPEAQIRWQRVIDAYPAVVIAHAQRAHAVHAQGHVLRAAELYHQLIRQFPDDVGAPISVVNLLGGLDEPQRERFAAVAEAGLTHLIRKHPDYAVLLLARARLAKARNDWPGALAWLGQARELDKADPRISAEIREVIEVIESRRRKVQSVFSLGRSER